MSDTTRRDPDLPRVEDVTTGSLTQEQVAYLTDMLSRHHGQPVRSASEYCAALRAWGTAITEKIRRIDTGEEEDPHGTASSFRAIVEVIPHLTLGIGKSNLLWRLIYLNEKVRTTPCPIHKGSWSGWRSPEGPDCACASGLDITGWLADDATPAGEHN
jgi:hypothetical protein